jgi:hypothetical protein
MRCDQIRSDQAYPSRKWRGIWTTLQSSKRQATPSPSQSRSHHTVASTPANTSHPTRPLLHMHARRVLQRTSNRCPRPRHMLASAFVFPSDPGTAVVRRLPAITRRTLFTSIGNSTGIARISMIPIPIPSSLPRSTRFFSRFRSGFNGFILRLLAVSDNVLLSIIRCTLQPLDHAKASMGSQTLYKATLETEKCNQQEPWYTEP